MKRRTFIKNTAAVSVASALAPTYLKAKKVFDVKPLETYSSFDDDKILIIIEMFGGNDGLNTIIPAYDDNYYKVRPQISIPKTLARRFQTTDVYMHPAIVDNIVNGGMMNLLETGRLAIIQGIGYEPSNLSHFRSQDIWYSGLNTSDPNQKLLEGWLGRFISMKLTDYPLVIPDNPVAVQIGGSLSMLLKTSIGDMGIALTSPDDFYTLGAGLTPKEKIRTVSNVYDKEFNFIRVIAEQSEKYSIAVKKAYDIGKTQIKTNYSGGLSQSMKIISSLIAGGLKTKVYYVKLSNFDSHAQQSNSDFISGQHPTLIGQVARAISEFLDDAQKLGYADKVVGFTMSEFGRRISENGSRGTDHGAGSMQFVFGNNVKGGYYGEKPDLTKPDENGNLPKQFDYRRTYTDILETWFGATQAENSQVFQADFLPIGVIKTTGVIDYLSNIGDSKILISPNPGYGDLNLSFELKHNALVDISIYNYLGMCEKTIYNGYLDNGSHQFDFIMRNQGNYFCSIVADRVRYVQKFSIIK